MCNHSVHPRGPQAHYAPPVAYRASKLKNSKREVDLPAKLVQQQQPRLVETLQLVAPHAHFVQELAIRERVGYTTLQLVRLQVQLDQLLALVEDGDASPDDEAFFVDRDAEAVVEGTGDHCCEYMTGGAVVVLGKVGRNVGAGMTGGLGYFLDEDETFPTKVNGEIVSMQRVTSQAGEAQLKALIEAHVAKTGSPKGAFVLVNWKEYLPKFWQLVPPSEANTPEASDEVVSAEAVNAA